MGKMPTNSLGKSSELKLHCFWLFDAYSMPKDMCSVIRFLPGWFWAEINALCPILRAQGCKITQIKTNGAASLYSLLILHSLDNFVR